MFYQRYKLLYLVLLVCLIAGCTNESNPVNNKKKASGTFYEIYTPFWDGFKDISEQAIRLRNLQIKSILLSPPQPKSNLMKLGDLGSPFAINDHLALDTTQGTREELKELVNTFHEYKISVFMDFYPAVIGRDHPLKDAVLTEEASEELYNPYDLPFRDVLVLNYADPQVLDYMVDAMTEWITDYNLDGLRVFHDAVVPAELYTRVREKTGCQFIFTGQPNSQLASPSDLTIDSSYMKVMFGLGKGDLSTTEYSEILQKSIEQPDFNRIIGLTNYILDGKNGSVPSYYGNAYKPLIALSLLSPGHFSMISGQEVPVIRNMTMLQSRKIKWSKNMDDDFYRQLLILKDRNRALHNTDDATIRIIDTNSDKIVAFEKSSGSHKVVFFANFAPKSTQVRFSENIFNLNDYITQRPVSIRSDQEFTVGPFQFYLLSNI